ncbi:MAG TPA: ribonuclease J [Thermoanaerobaculia bacterium]|nr:ribonuclease J [Thermoanaerobaculia bacterium]
MSLRIIPIGGLGEFGMNMMVYETDRSAIVVDCGMMFPDASILGVDVVIPDMSWVFEREGGIDGIFLTHGHEDHIGAVPFLIERVKAPVWGTPLTLGFIEDKLDEFEMREGADLRLIEPRVPVRAGEFEVEGIHVTHSIVDALAFAIRTPFGTVLHTGDFKLDQRPIDGRPTDLARIAARGEEGILALVSDSTNAVFEGVSGSESIVSGGLERVFSRNSGKIVVTTFASHIHRIQQIVDQAARAGRKVFFVGRSVVDNVETAERLGALSIPRSVRTGAAKPADLEPSRVVIVTTGTQGEPGSALARIALDEHKSVRLDEGDTVILSARTIPGNERAVSHMIDHLFRRGADVIYDEIPQMHVSGHGLAEELRTMINLARPTYFIPMHGSLRHLVRHAQIAESVGIPKKNVFVITSGEVLEIAADGARVLEQRVPTGKVFIDHQFEEVAPPVVRDRKHLAEDGFVIVVVALDSRTGQLVRDPEIITRGLLHVDASAEMLEEVRELLISVVTEATPGAAPDAEIVQERMRAALKRYFRKTLERRPMILPVVWEM